MLYRSVEATPSDGFMGRFRPRTQQPTPSGAHTCRYRASAPERDPALCALWTRVAFADTESIVVMNDQEREAARLGIEALDGALVALGYPPIGENPHVRMTAPVIGDIPNAIVEKPGTAPLRFVFGRDLDVWVGPFSEVVSAELLGASRDHVQHRIAQVLRSEVTCRVGRRWVKLVLQIPDQKPWLRLRVCGGASSALGMQPRYAPYAP